MVNLFQIQLCAPSAVLYPGQTVNAKCLVVVSRETKISAITVQILGTAKASCYTTEYVGEVTITTKHSSSVVYTNDSMIVWKPKRLKYGLLQRGVYEFPFCFTLPTYCPPSFEGSSGSIKYHMSAKLVRPWFNKSDFLKLQVIPFSVFNSLMPSPVQRSFTETVNKYCCFGSSGQVHVTVYLPNRNILPRQSFEVNLQLRNHCSAKICKIQFCLIQIARYNVPGGGPFTSSRCVAAISMKVSIRSFSESTDNYCVSFPSTYVPSFNNCSIIHVEYELKTVISVDWFFSKNISCEVPVVVSNSGR
uniref:Arrestin C-terminal-like domain-containing protein n=1 Tax=Ditylenchus dipsaci TaxID=166011 RepID=A0A915CZ03_9BILA